MFSQRRASYMPLSSEKRFNIVPFRVKERKVGTVSCPFNVLYLSVIQPFSSR